MMIQAFRFSINVWVTGLLLGSALSDLPFLFHSNSTPGCLDMLGLILAQTCIAAMLSICSWLLLLLVTYLLTRQPFNVLKVKVTLSAIGLLLAMAPLLWLTGGSFGVDWTDRLSLIAYPATIIGGIWFYALEPTDNKIDIITLQE